MKECANEDLEIRRMRQMLAQGLDDTNIGDGTIEIREKGHSVTELIKRKNHEETCTFYKCIS